MNSRKYLPFAAVAGCAALIVAVESAAAHDATATLSCDGARVSYTQFAPGQNSVSYELRDNGVITRSGEYDFTLSGPGLTDAEPLVLDAPYVGTTTRTLTTSWTAQQTSDGHAAEPKTFSARLVCESDEPSVVPPPAVPPTPITPPTRERKPPILRPIKRSSRVVRPGAIVLVRLYVRNIGERSAKNVVLRDKLPSGLVLLSQRVPRGRVVNGEVRFLIRHLAAGATARRTFRARVLPSFARTRICNSLTIGRSVQYVRARTRSTSCMRVLTPPRKPRIVLVTG